MDVGELRQAFAAFLGDERFRQFVAAGWRRGRLRYWQEQEWRRFCSDRPGFDVSLSELESVFRVCEVHGDELRAAEVQQLHGCVEHAQDYLDTRDRLFPYAATGPLLTQGAPDAAIGSGFGTARRVDLQRRI